MARVTSRQLIPSTSSTATTTTTLTLETTSFSNQQQPQPITEALVLKLKPSKKKVSWKEGTVDNEFMSKKSSKYKWDDNEKHLKPETRLLQLWECLKVFTNLRPATDLPQTANKELKGMMKTVKIQDIDNLQDEMMDLMDVSNEIQESIGRSYSVPDDIDEEELMGEPDALEADMEMETKSDGMPSYLQPYKEFDLDSELNLPEAPTGHAPAPGGRTNAHTEDELGLPTVPQASLRG